MNAATPSVGPTPGQRLALLYQVRVEKIRKPEILMSESRERMIAAVAIDATLIRRRVLSDRRISRSW